MSQGILFRDEENKTFAQLHTASDDRGLHQFLRDIARGRTVDISHEEFVEEVLRRLIDRFGAGWIRTNYGKKTTEFLGRQDGYADSGVETHVLRLTPSSKVQTFRLPQDHPAAEVNPKAIQDAVAATIRFCEFMNKGELSAKLRAMQAAIFGVSS